MNDDRIWFAGAVPAEIEGLHGFLDYPASLCRVGGHDGFIGQAYGVPVGGIVTGPGMLNAAMALTALAETAEPRVIIQLGCAGVFTQSGLNLLDVCVADAVIDAASGLETSNPDRWVDPLPFPILKPADLDPILSNYPVNPLIIEPVAACIRSMIEKNSAPRVMTGPILSVSTITTTDQRADLLYRTYHPLMEAMEGAGMAHVCHHYQIPFCEIRVASNRVGNRDRDAWNLSGAFEQCRRILEGLVQANLSALVGPDAGTKKKD